MPGKECQEREASSVSIRVTVWGEHRHEKTDRRVAKIYPEGMHEAIASFG
jgi:trehalose utilization protein